jgi:hypothetical protein
MPRLPSKGIHLLLARGTTKLYASLRRSGLPKTRDRKRKGDNMQLMSPETNELFSALSKAQGGMLGAKKSSNNPFFKSQYADLASCIDASRSALSSHGLAVVQSIVSDEKDSYVFTLLGHSSGQWIGSRLKIVTPDQKIQTLGSCITYLRRYSYCAIVGLAQVDDDGDTVRQAEDVKRLSEEQANKIKDELGDDTELEKFILDKKGVRSIQELPADCFNTLLQYVKKKKETT